MPFDAGTAEGKLDLDVSGFTSALRSARNGLGGFLQSAGGVAANALKVGLVGGAVAAAAGVAGLTAALVKGSRDIAEYEQAAAGLSNVLENQLGAGFERTLAEVEEFASALQRTTGVADVAILNVGRSLAALGITGASLRPAIQTTLDFAAAMGIDAQTAARGFAQTLDGQAGVLGRYLPALRNLTKEQLQAGAAFDLAREAAAGQAEALGNTFTGRLDRLAASFADFLKLFGGIFNDALGPVITDIQGAIDELTDRFSQGAGLDKLREFAAQAAETLNGLLVGALTVGPGVLELFINMTTIVAILGGAFAKLAELVAIAFGAFDTAETIGALTNGLLDATRGAIKFRDEINKTGKTLKGVIDPTKSIAENVAAAADTFGLVRKEADKTKSTLNEVNIATGGTQKSVERVLDLWRKVNEEVDGTSGGVDDLTNSTNEAASAAGNLADEYDSVAASAGAAASNAAEAGRQIASLSASRTVVSRQTLDFSDPFRAVGLAEQALGSLGRSRFTAFGGATSINAARAFAEGVVSQTNASLDRAFADFTTQVLSELNAAGVFDASERNRILRERIAEAQRLGALPSQREIGFNTRGF